MAITHFSALRTKLFLCWLFSLIHFADNFIVAWKRGIAIISAGTVKVTPDPRIRLANGYSLEIRDAVPQDAGDYICQIATLEPREITHTVEILGKFDGALPRERLQYSRDNELFSLLLKLVWMPTVQQMKFVSRYARWSLACLALWNYHLPSHIFPLYEVVRAIFIAANSIAGSTEQRT